MSELQGAEAGVEWASAGQPYPGELVSGDASLVTGHGDLTLVAVLDGLGHGPAAALAARTGIEALQLAAPAPIEVLARACHEALRGTRGAALTLALIDRSRASLQWLAVGDVEARLFRQPSSGQRNESVPNRGGIVGERLPLLRASISSFSAGDVLICATDGVGNSDWEPPTRLETPRAVAARILRDCIKGTDDALVVVVRCTG